MSEQVQVLTTKEVLGREFTIYGSVYEPLFLAKDVAKMIEYDLASINKMLKSIDDDEKLIGTLFRSGQNRQIWFLTENGLYEVLMQSRKPIAKQFKSQVKAILKEIRLYGGYIPGNTAEEVNQNALDIANRKIADLNKQFSELNYQYQLMRNDNNQLNNRLNQLYDEIETKCNAEVERAKYYTSQDVLNTVHAPIYKNDIDLYIQILGWKKQVGLSITVDGSKISQLFAGEDGIIFTEEGYKELVHFINHSRKVIYYNLKETNLI